MKLDNKSLGVKIAVDALVKSFPCNSFEEAKEEFEASILTLIMFKGIDGVIMACDPRFSSYCNDCIKELERRFK